MNVLSKKRERIDDTNRRLRNLEHELRERKADRLARQLGDEAGRIAACLAADAEITVESSERTIVVRRGKDRDLRLSFTLHFDETELTTATFNVRDRQVRRQPDYEQIESTQTFPSLAEASRYIVRALS